MLSLIFLYFLTVYNIKFSGDILTIAFNWKQDTLFQFWRIPISPFQMSRNKPAPKRQATQLARQKMAPSQLNNKQQQKKIKATYAKELINKLSISIYFLVIR